LATQATQVSKYVVLALADVVAHTSPDGHSALSVQAAQ
jgi:hypothetical protein